MAFYADAKFIMITSSQKYSNNSYLKTVLNLMTNETTNIIEEQNTKIYRRSDSVFV